MPIKLQQMPPVSVGATEIGSVSFVGYLDSGETLTSATVTEVTTTDLTIANVAVNSAALTIRSEAAGIGQAVQFSVRGQKAGTIYTLLVTGTTNSSPVNRVLPVEASFECV
jgi:hypothetical protein